MSCILRISGESLDIDTLLSRHDLRPDRTWKKGETRSVKGKVHSDCGATFIASDADLDEFDRQVEEATAFLELHSPTIAAMVATPGVQHAVLDFGVSLTEGYVAQFCYFAPSFVRLVANSGIGLEVSHYACCSNESES
jgi:hypothetical protein